MGQHAEDTVPGLRISDTARTIQPSIFETEMPVIDCAKLLPIYILLSGLLLKIAMPFLLLAEKPARARAARRF